MASSIIRANLMILVLVNAGNYSLRWIRLLDSLTEASIEALLWIHVANGRELTANRTVALRFSKHSVSFFAYNTVHS